ncbi:hypothetical protein LIA77_09589 [Sarocladium implicatum]|nr:hypothetical protein LIA77_09589 [Sarocladium implicatum]
MLIKVPHAAAGDRPTTQRTCRAWLCSTISLYISPGTSLVSINAVQSKGGVSILLTFDVCAHVPLLRWKRVERKEKEKKKITPTGRPVLTACCLNFGSLEP